MSDGFSVRLLYPLVVEAGANTIVTDLGSVVVNPGVYYWVQPNSFGVPSMLDALNTAFSSLAINYDRFEFYSPTQERLVIIQSTSVVYDVKFSDPLFTFPPEFLGFPYDQDSDFLEEEHIIDAQRSSLGSWLPVTIDSGGGGEWTSILSHPENEVYASTDPIYSDTKIIRMRKDRIIRGFFFENVPGLRVHGGDVRGKDSAYRATAKVRSSSGNDGYNMGLRAMYDHVRGGQEFIAIYDGGSELKPGNWERLRIATASELADFSTWYDLTHPAGEFYDVNFTALVTGGGYDY